jgi:hypothetical protein
MLPRFPRIVPVAVACAAAYLATPRTARADEVRSIVPSTPESPGHPDPLLAMTGAVVLGLPYGFSIWGAAASNVPSDRWLYIPVGGPWVDLIVRHTCSTTGCQGADASEALPLAIDGLAQAAGLAILVTSFASKGEPPPSAFALRVAPTSYRGGGGVSAFGTF